jgi:DNA-binding NarL/FixJ family response regulator
MVSNEIIPISILIADDHPLFRRGMRSLLSPIHDFKVVGEASTGEETIRLAAELQPDVILMDLQMPGGNGLAATRTILQSNPDIRILVVTLFEDDDSVFAALRAGARGYVLKDSRDEEMVRAIRAVGNREAIFIPGLRPTRKFFLSSLSASAKFLRCSFRASVIKVSLKTYP